VVISTLAAAAGFAVLLDFVKVPDFHHLKITRDRHAVARGAPIGLPTAD
jgi:hypothetical protein